MQDYSVREGSRASNVRLRVTVDDGLVVVIPDGFDHSRIPELLDSERAWIEKASRWADEQRLLITPRPQNRLPREIYLQAVGERFSVLYRATDSSRVVARDQDSGRLRVSGNIANTAASISALRRWVARKANHHLVPWLRQLSDEQLMPFEQTTVRNQSTRWASCSPGGTISINQKMLFLPGRLVRYVFIHELCHLVHLNHSSRFWSLVGRKEPAYRVLDHELRAAWKYVPAWMEE